jgi:hypothetical protein
VLLIAQDKLKQSGLLYSLSFDMVINRLRFAKVTAIAHRLFGETGAAVVEELAVHGRLKVAQICSDAGSKLFEDKKNSIPVGTSSANSESETDRLNDYNANDYNDKEEINSNVLRVFELMVQRRMIVVVPPLEIKRKLLERSEKNAATLSRVSSNTTHTASYTSSSAVPMANSIQTVKTQLKRKRKDAVVVDNKQVRVRVRVRVRGSKWL